MKSLFFSLAVLVALSGVATAQTYPAPTLPLSGTDVTPCLQGGGYKSCTLGNVATFSWTSPTFTGTAMRADHAFFRG